MEVKNQDGVYQEATINKLTDASIYTVGKFRNTTLCFPQHSAALFVSVYGEPSKGGLHFFQSVLLKKKNIPRAVFTRLLREGKESRDLSL